MSVGRPQTETQGLSAPSNGAEPEAPPPTVEQQLQLCAWLIAELQYRNLRLATTLATMVAQQMQPQVQQSVLTQLLGTPAG